MTPDERAEIIGRMNAIEFLVANILANMLMQTDDPLRNADAARDLLVEQARMSRWEDPAGTGETAATMLVELEEILADVKDRVRVMQAQG